jgi:hypothetical protein
MRFIDVAGVVGVVGVRGFMDGWGQPH